MIKGVKLLIACYLMSLFLVSCSSNDQKEKAVKNTPVESIQTPVESLSENSESPEYNCDNLQYDFSSYEEAKEAIAETEFRIEETIDTPASSWIRGASYYSCDGITGFFILITDSKDYLYSDVPLNVWQGFKRADSFGSYYNQFIKNKYSFELN